MNAIHTFKLWLEPDTEIPRFKRLRWQQIEVPVADVLLQGVHPWMSGDKHYSLPDAFLRRLNDEAAKVPGLLPFNLCWDVLAPIYHSYGYGYDQERRTKFERTLETLRKDVVFVDGLTYPELLEIAKERLRTRWNHALALTLLTHVHASFPEQRRFLKSKDKSIKLSGRAGLDNYDLGRVLSLEDFVQRDVLIVSVGIPTRNFRLARSLDAVTDGQGRLRLIPEIHRLSVSTLTPGQGRNTCGVHVSWEVERQGQTLHFRPELGDSRERRVAAAAFAEQWRTSPGRLCFRTNIARLTEMLERDAGKAAFDDLNYNREKQSESAASAQVGLSRINVYTVGRHPTANLAAEHLREILRAYSVSMTGNKEALVEKIAALAASEYEARFDQLDRFFRKRRFVRIEQGVLYGKELDVLEDVTHLGRLLVTMYLMKHLRGGAVLDPDHENNTYTVQELAQALLNQNVTLGGSFLRVV